MGKNSEVNKRQIETASFQTSNKVMVEALSNKKCSREALRGSRVKVRELFF